MLGPGPMSRLRAVSNGFLLAALVLGFIVVITRDDRVDGSAAPPGITSTLPTAANKTPRDKPPGPKAPTSKRSSDKPTASSPPKRPSAPDSRKPRTARPEAPKSQGSRTHRSRPEREAPAKRGGTVYLTFDDGPSQFTPAILNILRAMHSTATFFELGSRQAEYPAEAARIRAEGSNIGNHTYNHPDLTELKPGQVRWQLAHGPRSRCVRPPYGASNPTVKHILAQQGLRQVLWTVDTRDWSRPGTQQIVKAATGPTIRAGSIVLLHDGGGDRSETVAALPQIIATLQHHGFVVRRIPGC
jgi:peptidoglycan-N-acetylglucosamine deacetylase